MRLSMFSAFALTAIIANSAAAPAASGSASLNVCNRLSTPLRLAVGYFGPGLNNGDDGSLVSNPFVSHGYWLVAPSQCQTLENPFRARYMFLFGVAAGFNDDQSAIAQARENKGLHFCVSNYFVSGNASTFTFEGENASTADCDKNGTTLWIKSRQVDTIAESTVNITAPVTAAAP